jgi:hypothetical protein
LRRYHKVKLGQVNIDEDDGMALAQEHGVLDVGIPSIWAYDRSTGAGAYTRSLFS